MKLEIITERESSPFRHVFPAECSNGRRYGTNPKNMQKVMGEFLDSLGLGRNIRTLEVGAGSNQETSKALLALGAKPATLDADWDKFCKESIPTTDDLDRLGEAQLYPTLTGKNGVIHYLGDVAFIGNERSQLRNEKFDLFFYWGSIHGTDFSSSIARSSRTREFGIEIPLEERLVAPVQNVDNLGYMAYMSGFFNYAGDPCIHPQNVMCFNGKMIDTLLLWANHDGRKPARALVFGLNPDFAFEYLRKNSGKDCFGYPPTEAEIKEAVDNDTIGIFMAKHWSMFSDYEAKDSSKYRRALEVFSPAQQKAISDLGLVDCVAVQYRD